MNATDGIKRWRRCQSPWTDTGMKRSPKRSRGHSENQHAGTTKTGASMC